VTAHAAPSRSLAFAALAVLAALACAPDPSALEADGVRVVTRAWLHPSVSEKAPALGDLDWREVGLTDYWGLRRRLDRPAGWYRVEFARPAGTGAWTASLHGDWDGLTIELNGRRVLRAGPPRSQLGDRRAGILLPLPPEAAGPGVQTLLLRFASAPSRIGYLEPITIGPSRAVIALHDRLAMLQPTFRTALAAVAAACGLFLALLRRWDPTRAIPWLAGGTLVWSAGLLQPSAWLAELGHGFFASLCLHLFPVFFTIGLHRRLGLDVPRRERALVAAALLPAAARLTVPPVYVPAVDGIWWLIALAIGLYVLHLVALVVRRGSFARSGVLFAGTAVIVAAGAHDLASLFLGRAPLGMFLFQFTPGVLVLCTTAMLVATLGGRLGEAERLNVELEDRVEERRRELASSYARMAELERGRAIAGERERLMREMHDGTGGALVSAIAMAESGGAAPAAVAEVLRDALADLRLSIDSLDPSEPDLVSLLGAARARLEPRFEGRGVRIIWDVREVPRPAGFGPESALQVLRVFQEAIVNAMRHAAARTITVRTAVERAEDGRDWIAIVVADDGRGFDPQACAPRPGGGRGLGNMRRRAAALGGDLALVSGPGGSCVRLRLPVAPAR
jgi:signal transduction histidine kinase